MTINIFKSFRGRYIHILNVEGPQFERTWTQEIQHPYRTGETVILRFPFTKLCIGFGKWSGALLTEEEALKAAVGAREMKTDAEDIRSW